MLTKRAFTMRIVLLELRGFALLVAVVWCDEFFDLPHRFAGVPATPVNWVESLIETVILVLFAAATCAWTWQAVSRIRYLEGVLRICSYCKRVDAGGRWVAFETYITEHSAALFSHGLCPDCARQHYPDQFQTSGTNEAQT